MTVSHFILSQLTFITSHTSSYLFSPSFHVIGFTIIARNPVAISGILSISLHIAFTSKNTARRIILSAAAPPGSSLHDSDASLCSETMCCSTSWREVGDCFCLLYALLVGLPGTLAGWPPCEAGEWARSVSNLIHQQGESYVFKWNLQSLMQYSSLLRQVLGVCNEKAYCLHAPFVWLPENIWLSHWSGLVWSDLVGLGLRFEGRVVHLRSFYPVQL